MYWPTPSTFYPTVPPRECVGCRMYASYLFQNKEVVVVLLKMLHMISKKCKIKLINKMYKWLNELFYVNLS